MVKWNVVPQAWKSSKSCTDFIKEMIQTTANQADNNGGANTTKDKAENPNKKAKSQGPQITR